MKIGIIGGGQLAQMLILAGYPLGLQFICFEQNQSCPAGLVAPIFVGEYQDINALQAFAQQVDLITYEFENISVPELQQLSRSITIYPDVHALEISQDRLLEKDFFSQHAIPTTDYRAANTWEELQQAVQEIGLPVVIKTRRFGYDGKGQYIVHQLEELAAVWQALAGQALLVENFVQFDREVSLIAVRDTTGAIVFYPLIENHHRSGILALSFAPDNQAEIENLAQHYLTDILNKLNYVGVLTVEFFQKGNQLFANEMAPRVHNSGHWTIEGAQISQFENHLRAITGLPLGSTQALGHAVMINLIGELPEVAKILNIPQAHFHSYSKQPKPKRKLGHVTLCERDQKDFLKKFHELYEVVFGNKSLLPFMGEGGR